MERHKFIIEVGEYYNGNGAWMTDTNKRFETVVECQNSNQGTNMLLAQYGGQDRCRITWAGRA